MRAHFGLPSVEAEDKEGKPPISVKFEIPYFTTSGIQVCARGCQGLEQMWAGPRTPHRDPESVHAQRVAGDTQQHNQLSKAFSLACPRCQGAAPAASLHRQRGSRQKEARPCLLRPDPVLQL